jgi:hypothetical protein
MDTRTYSGVNRADVEQLRADMGKFGIKVPEGDDVEVTGPLGVRMHIIYDATSEILKLSIVDKPAFVTESQIWKVVEMSAGKLNGSK